MHFDNDPTWNFLLDSSPPPRNPIAYTTVDGIVNVTQTMFHDVAITNLSSPKEIIFQGYTGNITATVTNNGNYPENVNVTFYANTAVIGTFTNVALTLGSTINLIQVWDATGFAKGNYTISASVTPVPGETNTANNNFTDGWIMVTMVGDLTGPTPFVPDGVVNIRDISVVAKAFGSTPGMPLWNANCDVNNDGIINIRDISIVAKHFGQIDP